MSKKLIKKIYFVLSFLTILGMLGHFSFMGVWIKTAQAADITITGTVTAPGGGILVDYSDFHVFASNSTQPESPISAEVTPTTPGGTFTLTNVPVQSDTRVYVVPLHDLNTNAYTFGYKAAPSSSGDIDNLELTYPIAYGTIKNESSVGVPGIRVELVPWEGTTWGMHTDTNGYYQIGVPKPSVSTSYSLQVIVEDNITGYNAPLDSGVSITVNPIYQAALNRDFTLVTAPKTITGKVVRQDGVTGATKAIVLFTREQGPGSSSKHISNADGSYSVSLAPGNWIANVGIDYGSDAVDYLYTGKPVRLSFANDNSAESQTLNFIMTDAKGTVIGKVLKPDGTPPANCDVNIRNAEGIGTMRKTNASDGTFTIGLPAGTYNLHVFYPLATNYYFPDKFFSIIEGQTYNVGTITGTTDQAHIKGKVTYGSGTAVSNANINATQEGNWSQANTTTDNSGNYDLTVRPGYWRISIGQTPFYSYMGDPLFVTVPSETSTVSDINFSVNISDFTVNGSVKDASGNLMSDLEADAYIQGDAAGNNSRYYYRISNGYFNFQVPSTIGSQAKIGIQTLPNSTYSATSEQTVNVTSGGSTTVTITVKPDDATISGTLSDQNGVTIHSIGSTVEVYASDNRGNLKRTEMNSNGTYSMSVLAGDWNVGYNIVNPENTNYINRNLPPTPVTVAAGATATQNITLYRSDATITGTITDGSGNAVPRVAVFADTRMVFEKAGTAYTPADVITVKGEANDLGQFTLNVLGGYTYAVGAGKSPNLGSTYMPPKIQEIAVGAGESKTANLAYRQTDGVITGTVKISNQAVSKGYVAGWSTDGSSNQTTIGTDGSYSLSIIKGETWSLRGIGVSGKYVYQGDEKDYVPTENSNTKDLNLSQTDLILPNPVYASFDATVPKNITLEDGTTINIPANAIATSGMVSLSVTPTLEINYQAQAKPVTVGYEIRAKDSSGYDVKTLNQAITIKMKYSEDYLTDLSINENSLQSDYWDQGNSLWKNSGSEMLDKNSNELVVQTTHLTKFALTSASAGTMQATPGVSTTPVVSDILVAPASKGGPQIVLVDGDGKVLASFFAYDSKLRVGLTAVTADVDSDGEKEIIVAPGAGVAPQVRIFSRKGKVEGQFYAYDSKLRAGIRVYAGDVNGDGAAEIVTAIMEGAGPEVRVFNSKGTVLSHFNAYASTFRNGFRVMLGDVNGDGTQEIIVLPDKNAGPQIKVFNYQGKVLSSFWAYAKNIRGGYNATVGDVNGDGVSDILIATKAGLAPQVVMFKGDGTLIGQFFTFAKTFRGGFNISVGDVNGDGTNEIIACPESSAGPQIRVFTTAGKVVSQFWAYSHLLRGKFTSFVADVNGDGSNEIITAPGEGMGPQVAVFDYKGTVIKRFFTHHKGFRGGLNIFKAER